MDKRLKSMLVLILLAQLFICYRLVYVQAGKYVFSNDGKLVLNTTNAEIYSTQSIINKLWYNK